MPAFWQMMLRLSALLLLSLWLTAANAAEAPGHYEGVLGGAEFWIDVPADWNSGGLVLYGHGYEGEGPGSGTLHDSPLTQQLARRGYASAVSGYRAKGYRPDWFLLDLLALKSHFVDRFGAPRWTIVHGQSMGGHVAISSLELHPDAYQGALIECGVIDGVGLIDWLYAYTAAAEYFSGLPLLDTPRPEFGALVNAKWRAAMGEPGDYTEAGKRFDSVVRHLAGGDLPLFGDGLSLRFVQNLNPRNRGPNRVQEFTRHADTRYIRYEIDPRLGVDSETLNREIRRVEPMPGARAYDANPVFAELTGKIRAPVMSVHETGDLRVPLKVEQNYRRRTEKAGTSQLLVQRTVRWPGHCGIDSAAREAALDDLVAWIEKGTRPEGDDVFGDPAQLGLRWTPVRHPKDVAVR
jgi:pimeloyl-ACP methyl ester carboxylesterase